MDYRELLSPHRLDSVAIEQMPREGIPFTRLLPIELPNKVEIDHAVTEANLLAEALNVVGWTAFAMQHAEVIDTEYSQEHSSDVLQIFHHISHLQDFNHVPNALNVPLFDTLSRLLTSHADIKGVLPENARRYLESLRRIQTKLMLQQPLQESERSSFIEITSFCFGSYAEEIQREIEAAKELKGGKYLSYAEFCANTPSHTLSVEAIVAVKENISNIAHDMGNVIGRYRNSRRASSNMIDEEDLSSLQEIGDVRSTPKQMHQRKMWESIFEFCSSQAQLLEKGLLSETRSVDNVADILVHALQEVVHINLDVKEVTREFGMDSRAWVNWSKADMERLVNNVLQNAQRVLEAKWDLEREQTGEATTERLNLQTSISIVSELPEDAIMTDSVSPESKGSWLKITFDDDGLGIGEKVKEILGPRAFLSGQHGWASERVKTNGDGMTGRQKDIEDRGGHVVVRNRVIRIDGSEGLSRDVKDQPVLGARIEIYLPVIPGL